MNDWMIEWMMVMISRCNQQIHETQLSLFMCGSAHLGPWLNMRPNKRRGRGTISVHTLKNLYLFVKALGWGNMMPGITCFTAEKENLSPREMDPPKKLVYWRVGVGTPWKNKNIPKVGMEGVECRGNENQEIDEMTMKWKSRWREQIWIWHFRFSCQSCHHHSFFYRYFLFFISFSFYRIQNTDHMIIYIYIFFLNMKN